MTNSQQPMIVSLGVNCEVRMVIKEWEAAMGGIPDDVPDRHLRGNNFFDWNITNVWAIIGCLDNDFADVFLKKNLIAKQETDGKLNYIEDKSSTILFHHTFTRINDITDQETIEREYDEKREKVQYLIDKFRATLELDSILVFVRRGDENPGETITLLKSLHVRRSGRPFVLVAVRSRLLEAEIPEPYASHYRQVVLPPGDWTAAYWKPVFDTITATVEERLPAVQPT